MTAKEKAKLIFDKYRRLARISSGTGDSVPATKQCALICVDEMIKQNGELYLNGIDEQYYRKKNAELFELKQEIEKL